jgi:hypothetical protein
MMDADSRGAAATPTTKETSYILLGEGDFTYSLDACRYLVAASSSSPDDDDDSSSSAIRGRRHHSITCTGIDSIDELRAKYRDVDFVLGGIRSCSSPRVTTRISHGVNAVRAEEECDDDDDDDDDDDGRRTTTHDRRSSPPSSSSSSSSYSSYDHVIFNHPHIGTEDALLHSRFLAHLFHASTCRWMRPDGGLLHLTLVAGQCERWKCLEWADRHGLVLLRRGKFVPPRAHPNGGGGGGRTHYSPRRHQSGRSFANRRRIGGGGSGRDDDDSETLVFGRAARDRCTNDADADGCVGLLLPWERDESSTGDDVPREKAPAHLREAVRAPDDSAITTFEESKEGDDADPFPCKYCPRSFRERRSLRNHMTSLHPDCDEVRSWDEEKRCAKKKKKKKKIEEEEGGRENDRKRKLSTNDGVDGKFNEATQQSDGGATPNRGDDDGLPGHPWTCAICEQRMDRQDGTQRATRRIFPNEGALLAHQRAKHFGVHLDIKPDWHRRNDGDDVGSASTNDVENDGDGQEDADPPDGLPTSVGGGMETTCCPICDRRFSKGVDESRHAMEFLPSSSAIAIAMAMARGITNKDMQCVTNPSPFYKCAHCSKVLRDSRALRQHENFCSLRRQ